MSIREKWNNFCQEHYNLVINIGNFLFYLFVTVLFMFLCSCSSTIEKQCDECDSGMQSYTTTYNVTKPVQVVYENKTVTTVHYKPKSYISTTYETKPYDRSVCEMKENVRYCY